MMKFEKHACDFKNESECQEELDDDVLDFEKEEARKFGE